MKGNSQCDPVIDENQTPVGEGEGTDSFWINRAPAQDLKPSVHRPAKTERKNTEKLPQFHDMGNRAPGYMSEKLSPTLKNFSSRNQNKCKTKVVPTQNQDRQTSHPYNSGNYQVSSLHHISKSRDQKFSVLCEPKSSSLTLV